MSPRHLIPVVAAALLMVAGPAYAGGHQSKFSSTPTTYDVSYPQCGRALPAPITGGIVGVNDGIVLSSNPCLASEWLWASGGTSYAPALYANTADPGPAYSSHWPTGQTAPQSCLAADPNSTACSYDYGWNYATDAVNRALDANVPATSASWWLDVETGNSWQTLESPYGQTVTAQANDRASLAGAVQGLKDSGIQSIGVYSTAYQWTQITGGTGTQFAGQPEWIAGTGKLSTAQNNCRQASFTGGAVTLAQYASNGYDADYHC